MATKKPNSILSKLPLDNTRLIIVNTLKAYVAKGGISFLLNLVNVTKGTISLSEAIKISFKSNSTLGFSKFVAKATFLFKIIDLLRLNDSRYNLSITTLFAIYSAYNSSERSNFLKIILGVSIVVPSTILGYVFLESRKDSRVNAPFPKGPFLIGGHLLDINNNLHRKHDWMMDSFEELNVQTYQVLGPGHPSLESRIKLVTINPKNLEYVLKGNFKNFEKGINSKNILSTFLGHGIFVVDGEKWKRTRKTASNIFTLNNFKNQFTNVFEEESIVLTNYLDSVVSQSGIVDINQVFYAFTLDSFGKIAFGSDLGCLTNPESPSQFATSFDAVQAIGAARFVNPFWPVTEYLTGTSKIYHHHIDHINKFSTTMIEKARKRVERNDILVDLFLDYVKEDGTGLDDRELRDVILNFIIAGRDTTALSLAWAIYLIATHADVEKKLVEEMLKVLGPDEMPDFQTLKSLKYCHAVFFETIRLYPAVPANLKIAVEDDTLPDGTFVPKGSTVFISPFCMARTKAIWGEDAKEFRPERWFDESGNLKKESQYKWPVFHAGPRICLGQNLATQEAVTVLCVLLRRYRIELVEGQKVTYGDSLTLPIEGKLMIKITKR